MGELTSTRALSRSTRCEISRYDLAALYSGSRSGNDQKNSCKSASNEETGAVGEET